jgi:hypothetical protein
VVGRVLDLGVGSGRPLLYNRGGFGRFDPGPRPRPDPLA